MALTKSQDRVLRFLYDHKNDEISIRRIASTCGMSEEDVQADIAVLQELHYVDGPPSLLSRVAAILRTIDDKIDATSDDYPAFVVLLASYIIGADESALAKALNYDPEFVRVVGARLRNCRLWIGAEMPEAVNARWQTEEGGIAFWLDASIASGKMICVDGDTDHPRYALSPAGKRSVERMMRPKE